MKTFEYAKDSFRIGGVETNGFAQMLTTLMPLGRPGWPDEILAAAKRRNAKWNCSTSSSAGFWSMRRKSAVNKATLSGDRDHIGTNCSPQSVESDLHRSCRPRNFLTGVAQFACLLSHNSMQTPADSAKNLGAVQ